MAYGLDENGLQIPTTQELRESIATDLQSEIDPLLDLAEDQILGQIVAINANGIAIAWEALAQIYRALDPTQAEGEALDIIGALRGVPRLGATYSTVPVKVDLDDGTTLTAGVSAVSGPGSTRWVLAADYTASGSGERVLTFRSENLGVQRAAPYQIDTIATSTSGWNSAVNESASVDGSTGELDPAYRARMAGLLSASGNSTVDAIRSDLSRIDQMRQVSVFENPTNLTNANGLPPHSFEVVLRDEGLIPNTTIAQAIWDTKPAGIETYGTETANATDSLGLPRAVRFSRAESLEVNVEVSVSIYSDLLGTSDIDDAIAEATSDFFATLKVGEDIVLNRLRAYLMDSIPAVYDVPTLGVREDYLGSPVTTSGRFSVGLRQYATLQDTSVDVEEVVNSQDPP